MYEYLAMGKPVIATRLLGVVKEFGFDSGICCIDRAEDALRKASELITAGNLGKDGENARRALESHIGMP